VEVGGVSVLADGGLLERVLANLIDNALRHSPRGTPVRVTAERTGDRVSIAVIDSGPGIPAGAEEQLFEPFQRLGDRDNTTGVGLGLSVVRGFVEAMGGTVHAEPTPGGGLTMLVDLPADDNSPAESSDASTEAAAAESATAVDGARVEHAGEAQTEPHSVAESEVRVDPATDVGRSGGVPAERVPVDRLATRFDPPADESEAGSR
jgi:two-component system sensor histidine kinase KdpD